MCFITVVSVLSGLFMSLGCGISCNDRRNMYFKYSHVNNKQQVHEHSYFYVIHLSTDELGQLLLLLL
jgi:hypothetical protein